MSTETKAVDVLEGLGDAISEFSDLRMTDRHGIGQSLIEAHAAVAELIEALRGLLRRAEDELADPQDLPEIEAARAALARFGGAK